MRNIRTVILAAALFTLPSLGSALADDAADKAMTGKSLGDKAMMDKPMMEKGMSGKSTTDAAGDDEAARKRKATMMMEGKAKTGPATVR